MQIKAQRSFGPVGISGSVTAVKASSTMRANAITVQGATPSPLFVGDYSTGNFNQWPLMQNKFWNSSPAGWTNQYPATIVNDAGVPGGKAARFEVRSGDWPGFATGERSEVSSNGDPNTGGTEGAVRWYKWAIKFDATFPTNHASLGWGVTNQWHPLSGTGSPPVGWNVDMVNGMYSLVIERQSSPGVYLGTYSAFNTPLNYGNWINVKTQIRWSTSDATGFVRAWINGVPQTLLGGTTTHTVRTLIPGDGGCYYKEGYYRQEMAPTGIVYHSGFKSATTEADLG